jgi:ubiquinone/menaquinone biosynthesis C-methylase UbiE
MRVMTVKKQIYEQFGRPHGALGSLAGWIMANRASNRQRNAWAVGLLEIEPGDRVLEIGFGPGLAIAGVAQRATRGRVVGIDHSATMLRQAVRRNRAAIAEGRVDLRLGGLDLLPALGGPFDKVLAVNVVQFWPDLPAALRAIRAVLTPGGRVALAYQPRHAGARPEDAARMAERVRDAMVEAGFAKTCVAELPLKPLPVVCILGWHRGDETG